MKPTAGTLLAGVFAALACPALSAPVHRAIGVEGLIAPASIVVDHWGVPHIFAASERDAYFLQGWNAARDRLWQIDLWRKRGLGLLSASFGPAYLAEDKAARLLLYRGDMTAEWAAYAPGMRGRTTAFADGVNAYVREVRAGRAPLPVEFRLTGSQPDLWTPADIVRIRSHALVSNLTSEVARARIACAVGPGWQAADALRRPLQPVHETKIPVGLDPCAISPKVLETYQLGTQAVKFSPERRTVAMVPLSDLEALEDETGSNNWVVAGTRTASGAPLVANDPHREIAAPSLRYIVQLSAPGLDLTGAAEPAMPGVSFGHNADAAFGLTIFGIDQEDLYVYDLNPADPDLYRYKGGWERMRVVREAIPVKGEPPREVELRFTRHGPVLDFDPATHRAFALRSVWFEPGAAGYLQAEWLVHARTWADFEQARLHWAAPPENFVWGDKTGDIGWAAFGVSPVRPNWDGLMPVPGDGRYEWAGLLPHQALPQVENPARGWFATANAYNLPADYPTARIHTAYEWADRSRLDRIEAVLGADAHVSVANSMALQTDSHVAIARRLQALIAPLSSQDPRITAALRLLGAWDRNDGVDSEAAAIYEVWTSRHLGPRVVAALAPRAAGIITAPSLDGVLSRLESSDPPPAQRDGLLLSSLGDALADLTTLLGPDMAAWRWGALHHAALTPAAAVLADPALRARMSLGPMEVPGGPNSPKAASYYPRTFMVRAGASVRFVMDVGDWDRSMMINTPGQAGDPASPHYGDLFAPWARGQYVPMLFTRPAIEAAADEVFDLTPAP